MTARAMWKGAICFSDVSVPVKLYSAVDDRGLHFRLLHRKDNAPVKQVLVNPESEAIVPYAETRRTFDTGEGERVLLSREELEALRPEKSREIKVRAFLPQNAIDHRWYERPYYLGPDGSKEMYDALAGALEASKREGLVYWVMRNKEYFGALRLYRGYPMLMSLRNADQVVSDKELEPPGGKALDKRELSMARQLIGMLEAHFDPEEYQDEYRARVMELIGKKQRGGRVKSPPKRKKKAPDDVSKALEASLRRM